MKTNKQINKTYHYIICFWQVTERFSPLITQGHDALQSINNKYFSDIPIVQTLINESV